MSEYGALNLSAGEDEHKVRDFKRSVGLAFVGLMVGAAVVAVASVATSSASSASVVDANRNKGQLAAVPGVMEKTREVLNMTDFGLRYAIFSFTPCCEEDCGDCKMVPVVQGAASDDWAADWTSFTNALPESTVAAAVYNFEYFVDEVTTNNRPVLITWAPPLTEEKEIARAGYYLGSIILATDGVQEHYPLDNIAESYMEFCVGTLEIDEEMCAMEGDFHNCPYANDECTSIECPDGTPCEASVCDGAAFVDPNRAADEGAVPEACCDYIEAYCRNPAILENSPGCHPVTLKSITKLCSFQQADETPELILPADEATPCDVDSCIQPCAFFEDINDTWKKCSGCPTDGQADADGNVYQCYPRAIGFELNRCCGIADECKTATAENAAVCDTLETFNCIWLEHSECPEELAQQEYDAAVPGCCDWVEGVNPFDCEGSFTEGACPVTEPPVVETAATTVAAAA